MPEFKNIFSDWQNTKVYKDRLAGYIREEVSAVLAKHNIVNEDLAEDIVAMTYTGSKHLWDSIQEIGTNLLDVNRYRNMKCFPVVVGMCQKAANQASQAVGYRDPFPDHYSARRDSED